MKGCVFSEFAASHRTQTCSDAAEKAGHQNQKVGIGGKVQDGRHAAGKRAARGEQDDQRIGCPEQENGRESCPEITPAAISTQITTNCPCNGNRPPRQEKFQQKCQHDDPNYLCPEFHGFLLGLEFLNDLAGRFCFVRIGIQVQLIVLTCSPLGYICIVMLTSRVAAGPSRIHAPSLYFGA